MKTLAFLILSAVSIACFSRILYVQDPAYNELYGSIASDKWVGTDIKFPMATWQKAFNTAEAGDTVYFRGGVWYPDVDQAAYIMQINPKGGYGNNGTYNNPIVYTNYPGEIPIADLRNCLKTNGGVKVGLNITNADYIKIKGLTIRNNYTYYSTAEVDVYGVYAGGNGTMWFENNTLHNISGKGWWFTNMDTLYVTNCDVHTLCDSLDGSDPGGDSDGFNISSGVSYGTKLHQYYHFQGCRAWNCSDDGFDISYKGELILDSCWSFFNGETLYGLVYAGDGVGIKIGTTDTLINNSDPISARTIKNSVITYNRGYSGNGGYYMGGGIDMNNLTGNNGSALYNTFYNNTIYYNYAGVLASAGGASGWDYPRDGGSVVMENNLIYDWSEPSVYYSTYLTKFIAENEYGQDYVHFTTESWDWKDPVDSWFNRYNPAFTITDDDFTNLDSSTIYSQLSAPRKADGSLPDITVLKLVEGSDLIDGGTDVGLEYNGDKPDLGAFESKKVPGESNEYPTIEITSPAEKSLNKGDITFIADAQDDVSVTSVTFYSLDTIIGTAYSHPFEVVWQSPPPGIHYIRAEASDNENAKSTTKLLKIYAIPGDIEIPPESVYPVQLFPNPNNGSFTYYLTEPLNLDSNIIVVSLEGKIVYLGEIHKTDIIFQLNLTHLDTGMYLITVSSEQDFMVSKFVKL